MSTCVICTTEFEARHNYGLCPLCASSYRMYWFDVLETARLRASKNGISPYTLTLLEWLSTLSDFMRKCAFCQTKTASVIERVDKRKGLTYDNVVPACQACIYHRQHGFDAAEKRVREYLSIPTRVPETTSKPELDDQFHIEYLER